MRKKMRRWPLVGVTLIGLSIFASPAYAIEESDCECGYYAGYYSGPEDGDQVFMNPIAGDVISQLQTAIFGGGPAHSFLCNDDGAWWGGACRYVAENQSGGAYLGMVAKVIFGQSACSVFRELPPGVHQGDSAGTIRDGHAYRGRINSSNLNPRRDHARGRLRESPQPYDDLPYFISTFVDHTEAGMCSEFNAHIYGPDDGTTGMTRSEGYDSLHVDAYAGYDCYPICECDTESDPECANQICWNYCYQVSPGVDQIADQFWSILYNSGWNLVQGVVDKIPGLVKFAYHAARFLHLVGDLEGWATAQIDRMLRRVINQVINSALGHCENDTGDYHAAIHGTGDLSVTGYMSQRLYVDQTNFWGPIPVTGVPQYYTCTCSY